MNTINNARIMVVDDLVEDTKLLTQILTGNHYQVRPFLSGKLALRSIEIEAPDLLLLDINMPEMDGYTLARIVHSMPGLEHLPIIFVSAYQDVEIKTKAFAHGGVDYITKPYQHQELLARVGVHLRLIQQTAALEQANRELESLSKAKSHFLSSMSHEIRTPMNAILGFTELLYGSDNLSEQERSDLDIISRSGEHLLAVINDVLEMSKIESGHINIQPSAMNVNELLRDVDTLFRLRTDNKGLQLVVEYSNEANLSIVADRNKLKQILINMLSNSLKFTQQGHIRLSVALQKNDGENLPSESAHLTIRVADTGVGIATDELDKVFSCFEQTQSGRESEQGTGLGMAISQQYAQLMGGHIKVDSTPGHGTTFELSIPCQISAAASSKTSPLKQPKVVGLVPGQTASRFLIVDDVKTNRMILKRLLDCLGVDVKEASNGKEALELFYQWHPNVIFTDIKMPIMNGYELVSIIKSMPNASRHTPIIAISAGAFEEDRQQILSLGVKGFIRKPFREAELMKVLAEQVGLEFVYQDNSEQETQNRQHPPCASL